jgi:prepilin-type N-terminal cleavage/methylation domain-containing protein
MKDMKEKMESRFPRRRPEAGMTLVELMMAMLILAISLSSLTALFVFAAYSNNKSSRDTSATLLSQLVLEQITAQHPNSTAPIFVTDCTGNVWDIAYAPGAAPAGAGALLVQNAANPYYGGIDPTQAYAAVPPATAATPGYAMQYVDCAQGGRQATYDVRWNVMTISPYARLVTVSTRQLTTASQLGNRIFALPATLRGIQGMQ